MHLAATFSPKLSGHHIFVEFQRDFVERERPGHWVLVELQWFHTEAAVVERRPERTVDGAHGRARRELRAVLAVLLRQLHDGRCNFRVRLLAEEALVVQAAAA